MKKRMLIGFIGLMIALLGAFSTNLYIKERLKEVAVVTVKEEVPSFTKISEEMLTTKIVGANGLDSKIIQNKKEVIGKYTTTKIIPGDVFMPGKLSDIKDIPQGYLYTIQPNDRIVSFPSNLTLSAGATVKAGDYIDLIVVIESKNGVATSKLFMQHIPVVDVRDPDGNELGEKTDKETGKIIATNPKKVPGAIVAAVKPDQAEQIALYSEIGKIYVAINPLNHTNIQTNGMQINNDSITNIPVLNGY
jgi:Flp pilus assembly protein CpaB